MILIGLNDLSLLGAPGLTTRSKDATRARGGVSGTRLDELFEAEQRSHCLAGAHGARSQEMS